MQNTDPSSPLFPPGFNPALFSFPFGMMPGMSGFPAPTDEDMQGGFGNDEPEVLDHSDEVEDEPEPLQVVKSDGKQRQITLPEGPKSTMPSVVTPFQPITGLVYKILLPIPVAVEASVIGADGNNLQSIMKEYGSQIKLLPPEPDNDGVSERTILISGGADCNEKTINALYDLMNKVVTSENHRKDDKDREERRRDVANDRFRKL